MFLQLRRSDTGSAIFICGTSDLNSVLFIYYLVILRFLVVFIIFCVYLRINYALYEELDAGDMVRTRDVYK